jgi:hypothetical protein
MIYESDKKFTKLTKVGKIDGFWIVYEFFDIQRFLGMRFD